MRASQLSARVVMATDRLLRDVGRYLLFMVILTAALLASLVGGILFFGVVLSPEASLVTRLRIGGSAAAALLQSFSDQQSLFIVSLWGTALLMGAAALWVYQQTLAKFEDLLLWLRTAEQRRG